MRIVLLLVTALLLVTPSFAQTPTPPPETPKPEATTPSCAPNCGVKAPSKSDLKKAGKLYEQAQKLQHDGQFEPAIELLDRAISLAPTVAEYVSLRESTRQQQVTVHINHGNDYLAAGKRVEAMAEFRQALELDPKNEFAIQRLQDSLPQNALNPATKPELSPALRVVSESRPTVLKPATIPHEFHFKGVSRNLFNEVCAAYGIKPIIDESVTSKSVRFEMEPVDFFTAIREASKLGHAFWVPISPTQIVIVNDTQALRRGYEHMSTRTFYLSDATTPTDVNDVVNLLRTIFDIRYVAAQPSNNSVVVRAPEAILEAAAKVLDTFLSRKPQVNVRVEVYQISHQLTRQIGLDLPTSFQAINVGAAALALQGQGNIQDLINQLFANGGINQSASAIQGLLAQLQNQQSSIFQQPFATVGGGKTLFAIPLANTTAHFSINKSDMKTLSTLTLRTAQGNAATMRLGSRYPILNASFAPLFNSSAISQVVQNGSFAQPFPSFSYEDLGITLKATPQVFGDGSVAMKIEMQIKALSGTSFNGVPVISNREYTGTMSLKDGEPAVVVGMITDSETKTLAGIPGVGSVPLLRGVTSDITRDFNRNELLIVVTPYIVSPIRTTGTGDEIYVPAS